VDVRCVIDGDREEGQVVDAGSEGGSGKEDKEMLTAMVVTTCLVTNAEEGGG